MGSTSRYESWHHPQPGPSTSTSVDYENFCAYCHESLSEEYNPTRKIKCGHRLHLICMNTHLPDEKKCPICKTSVKWLNITDKCAICFDSIGDDAENIVIPNCDHEMHYECLKQWFVTRKRCPVCRKSLLYMAETVSDYEDNDDNFEDAAEHQTADNHDYVYSQSSCSQSYTASDEESEYSDEPIDEAYYKDYCFYCKDSFLSTTEPQKRIKCGHLFHMRCANTNFPIHKKCPLCNEPINHWINTNDMCVKCRVPFYPTQERFTSICQHELHVKCAKSIDNKRCPICRCKLEGKSSDAVCAICLESFPSSQDASLTKCGHKFHTSCINDWRAVNNICPICRKPL